MYIIQGALLVVLERMDRVVDGNKHLESCTELFPAYKSLLSKAFALDDNNAGLGLGRAQISGRVGT